MAYDDNGKKGVGAAEIGAGVAVGSGVAVGYTTLDGALKFLKDGDYFATMQDISKAKVGDKLGALNVTEGVQTYANKIVALEPEYHAASRTGKLGVAFKSMGTVNKVALGAFATGVAIGTGMLVNSWRNSGAESHVQRLERERQAHNFNPNHIR